LPLAAQAVDIAAGVNIQPTQFGLFWDRAMRNDPRRVHSDSIEANMTTVIAVRMMTIHKPTALRTDVIVVFISSPFGGNVNH